jgi:hypothetical protein
MGRGLAHRQTATADLVGDPDHHGDHGQWGELPELGENHRSVLP